jgi:hypothetical protein
VTDASSKTSGDRFPNPKAGCWAEAAAARKNSKYREQVERQDGIFVPIALEAHGTFGSDVKEFIRILANEADRKGIDKKEFIRTCTYRIAARLQQGNQIVVREGMRMVSGRRRTGFRAGRYQSRAQQAAAPSA